jgi:hypothetical protein
MRALTTVRPAGGGRVAAFLVSVTLCSTPASAQDDGEGKILKAMSDYVAGRFR